MNPKSDEFDEEFLVAVLLFIQQTTYSNWITSICLTDLIEEEKKLENMIEKRVAKKRKIEEKDSNLRINLRETQQQLLITGEELLFKQSYRISQSTFQSLAQILSRNHKVATLGGKEIDHHLRLAVTLKIFLHGHSFDHTASLFGISKGTVHNFFQQTIELIQNTFKIR